MLTLFMNKYKGSLIVVHDIEEFFTESIRIPDNEKNRKLLRELDKSEYFDEETCVNEFGVRLRYIDMSTCVKFALCIDLFPEFVFDSTEVDIETRDLIYINCNKGNMIIHDHREMSFNWGNIEHESYIDGGRIVQEQVDVPFKCDVEMDQFHFTDALKLNNYLRDERDTLIWEGVVIDD